MPGLVHSAEINYPASMDRLPNRGRVAREAAKARPTLVEKAAKAPPRKHTKLLAISARVKVVWEVCSGTGKILKTYPYPDKAAAEAQTKALTWSTGRAHTLRAAKVPME